MNLRQLFFAVLSATFMLVTSVSMAAPRKLVYSAKTQNDYQVQTAKTLGANASAWKKAVKIHESETCRAAIESCQRKNQMSCKPTNSGLAKVQTQRKWTTYTVACIASPT